MLTDLPDSNRGFPPKRSGRRGRLGKYDHQHPSEHNRTPTLVKLDARLFPALTTGRNPSADARVGRLGTNTEILTTLHEPATDIGIEQCCVGGVLEP